MFQEVVTSSPGRIWSLGSILGLDEITYGWESGYWFFMFFLVQFRFGSISLEQFTRE
jgi:hypothetical protein